MKKLDLISYNRRGPVARALIGVLALLLAATVGTGIVVAGSLLFGPTHSDSATSADANQAIPTVSLPPNDDPAQPLADLDPNAPQQDPAKVQAAIAASLTNPALGSLTAIVRDATSADVLFEQGSATPMQPGSTIKLYTAVAAATTFDAGERLTTKVVAGSTPGEIVIVSSGDITLSSQPQSALYPGAATLQDLAAAIQTAGVGQITKITIDNSVFGDGATVGPGWGTGDAPSTYAAPVYPFMVDGGRSSTDFKAMRYAEPDLAAGQQLAALLGNPAAVVERGTAAAGAAEIASIQSAPIEDLIERMIVDSDNTLAEVLAHLVAVKLGLPATFEGGVQAVTQVATELGIDLTGFTGYDASGISALNYISAASLGSLLELVTSGTAPQLDVVTSALAVSGYNGTLATRYDVGDAASSAAGQVRGKTGTLSSVNSLAGTILTADGRLLVFAFISNGGADAESTRAALDDVAAAIAGCGCS